MSTYKNSDLQELFNISHDTVRAWADRFGRFLSPLANPGDGKHRTFNDDDLAIIALISDMRNKNMSWDEITAALERGEKGSVPDIAEERALSLGAELQLSIMRNELDRMQHQLEIAQDDARTWRDKAKLLEGEMKAAEKQMEELKNQQQSRDELLMEIGKLRAMLEIYKSQLDSE